MNILVFTYSVTRTAGGVFDAVRELFTNAAFKRQKLKIISFRDEYCDKDISAWNGLPIQLFNPGFMLYSQKAKRALLTTEADVLHMEALWRFPHRWMVDWKKRHKDKPLVCSPHGMLDPYIIQSQGKIKRIDDVERIFRLCDGTCIHFDDILDISSELFKMQSP